MPRPSSRTVRPLLGAASAALLVLAGACGDDDDTAGTEAPAATEPAGTEAPGTTASAEPAPTTPAPTDAPVGDTAGADASATTDAGAAGSGSVEIAESSLGPILVDEEGMTLYMFAPDDGGPSTCTDACLEAWPALTGPVTAGEGVEAALLATAPRPDDGSEQATCNGWPLYYFVQDAAPGDVIGQGANDVWFVLDATCTPVGMP